MTQFPSGNAGVAKAELETGGAREPIGGLLSFRYVENTDIRVQPATLGFGNDRFPILLVTGAVALAALAALLLRARWKASLPLFSLLLVTAGTIGNYLDRIFRGYVVDFVHLKHWSVFNVADVYITIGLVVLAWALFVKRGGGRPFDQASGWRTG